MVEKIGLVAGWGDLPIRVSTALKARGAEVFCLGLRGHADPKLSEICDGFRWAAISRTGSHVRYLRRHGIRRLTMAGKVFKTVLFQRALLWRHLPDLTFLRFFSGSLFSLRQNRTDDSLLMCAVKMYEHFGIHVEAATELTPEILIPQGQWSRRAPSAGEWADIRFGWQLAKEMGRLDVGQSVVVKSRAAIAVEALEGTDQCIRRAGELCRDGGLTVVKVAKPQQDMRFDVPTVGMDTLRTMHTAGARTLAVEAHRTIILNRDEVVEFADRHGIAIIALTPEELTVV